MSAGINLFTKFDVFHEVAEPYHPEIIVMDEQLIMPLKDKLHSVKI